MYNFINWNLDKSAVGWDHVSRVEKHESQTDYSRGFGGKYGVQNVQDKSAVGYDEVNRLAQHDSQKTGVGDKPAVPAKSLRERFEKMAMDQGKEAEIQRKRAQQSREANDRAQQAEERRREEERKRAQAAAPTPTPPSNAVSLRGRQSDYHFKRIEQNCV